MRKTTYLLMLAILLAILVLFSCTDPVKKDIFINISLIGEAAKIKYSKFSTSPESFHDNIVVNKYKVYLYQDGTEVYQQEFSNISNNTILLRLTNINSGTYTLRVEGFKDTTPIFYGEKVVQLSFGQNNIQLATYFNKAKLTMNVQNQTEGFQITQLSIVGSLPASPTNNFVENAPFQNKEIYPGIWNINLEATLTRSDYQVRVKYPTKAYEIYPSEDKLLNFVVKRDDLGNLYIDLLTKVELPYLDKVWNMKAERNDDRLKLMWDYNLPATFNIYRGDGSEIEFIGVTTEKYFVDTNPVSIKNHYYVNAIYGGRESGLCELVVDLQSPQVTIINPTNGTIVRGLVTVTAEAQDNVEVSKVEFYVDGTKIGEDTVKPYQYDWDTELTDDSTHTIQAKAYDMIGNSGQSNIVSVRVANCKPEVRIVSPTNGSTVRGVVTITAEAQDNVGVSKVEFYIDGTKVAEDTSEPYQYNWDTIGLTNDSTHTIQAKAYDIIGNSGQSDIVVVRVVNNIPQITIISPTDGETLHGTVTILAEVEDNEGIAQVEFFVNNKLLKGVISPPYHYAWNTYGVIDGTYTLKVRATNLLGNQNSESINVVVNNGQKTFGGNSKDKAYSIQQTTNGGYIIAGCTTSFGAGGYDLYILKLNLDGSLAWQKTFGGNRDDVAYSIQQTTDGGYIVAGSTYSFGAGSSDLYIVKLDSNGTLIWQKTFGGGLEDFAYFIQQTTDGGYIVAGYTNSFGSGGYDVYVLKLNSDGGLAWQKTFGGNGDDYSYSIQQTTDGGYIIAGYTTSFGSGGRDVYVLKLNSDGDLAWQKTFDGDEAYSVQQTTDGGYIVAGYAWPFGSGVYVLKLNPSGDLQWQKTFGGEPSDKAYSIQQTTDGGYIIAGTKGTFGPDSRDVYILKLNSDGTLAWQKKYVGSNDDYAYSIQQTTDGGYIVAGSTNSFGAGWEDVYILKLDSNGELHPFE